MGEGVVRDPNRLFAPARVHVDRRADGSILLSSPEPLGPVARSIGEYLEYWASEAPDRPFLRERGADGQWTGRTYAETREVVWRIGSGLLDRGLGVERPLAILSENSVEHALLTLGAMHVGVPVAPVSPAYSVMSRDFRKLATVLDQTKPGLIYVADHERYGPALAAVPHRGATIVSGTARPGLSDAVSFGELTSALNTSAVAQRYGEVGPGTIAKLLFTSGSTGDPKAVINTQGMLCANQQARVQVWPFLVHSPPVIVDWLPWSHTFGANHNFHLVLRHGGTLYIDGGRPVPPLFEQTVANLRDIAPTLYFNVPRGYDMLVAALEADSALRQNFFSRLQMMCYAGAALSPHLWDALRRLGEETAGEPVTVTSAWGSTETAPMATDCHFQADRSGVIGLPVPGTVLKLVPNADKFEARVRGPNVTPGYWRRPDLRADHFDEEGFYRIGDAVRFVDEARPDLGLLFDGRVAEDFKLDTGTWVNVGMLRVKAIAALAPVAQDVVVTGHDRPEIGFLVFPNLEACRSLSALGPDAAVDAVLASPAVWAVVRRGLTTLRDGGGGSSTYATRAALMREPPSIDRGEITDKGYINQRAVLTGRASVVAALYRRDAVDVIRPEA